MRTREAENIDGQTDEVSFRAVVHGKDMRNRLGISKISRSRCSLLRGILDQEN